MHDDPSVISENTATGEEDALTPELVRAVSGAIEARSRTDILDLTADLHSADMADLLELLKPEFRGGLIDLLGTSFDVEAVTELDEQLRDAVMERLPNENIAEAVKDLETDDAVYLLEDLGEGDRTEILEALPALERANVQRSLEYPEDSAGRLMQTDFVAVPPFWTIGQTIDYMREEDDLPDDFYEIFVVDPTFHLIGTVPLGHILRTRRPVRIEAVMKREQTEISALIDQEQVAHMFAQYNLVSAAVVDEDRRIVGVVTVDDIVDVIQEEAEEDIHRLAGVGDEELTSSVWQTARSRWTWLAVNLVTAIFASAVIGLFDATISQMVALAILMPIVASMGGNAATQTMTVAVRAMATHTLGPMNAMRVIVREMLVGLLNGVSFAIAMGGITMIWFSDVKLGLVIGGAMIINHFVAGLAGIVVPLALEKAGADPAIASTAFVTTVTDVVGFFSFLGLAALFLF